MTTDPEPDAYDDFTVSDVLAAFARHPQNRAEIYSAASVGHWLRLDGRIPLTDQQLSVISALIPVSRGGTAEPESVSPQTSEG